LWLGLMWFLSSALAGLKECLEGIEAIMKRIEKGQPSEFDRHELDRHLQHLETILKDIRMNLPT